MFRTCFLAYVAVVLLSTSTAFGQRSWARFNPFTRKMVTRNAQYVPCDNPVVTGVAAPVQMQQVPQYQPSVQTFQMMRPMTYQTITVPVQTPQQAPQLHIQAAPIQAACGAPAACGVASQQTAQGVGVSQSQIDSLQRQIDELVTQLRLMQAAEQPPPPTCDP